MSTFTLIDQSQYDFNQIKDLTFAVRLQEFINDPSHHIPGLLKEINNGYYRPFIDSTDTTFLDLGANIGLFSWFVLPQATEIVAVEPDPLHLEMLDGINQDISVVNKLIVHRAGVWRQDCEAVPFYIRPENPTMNGLDHNVDNGWMPSGQTVKTVGINTLLNHYNDRPCDFVKVDIEGSEHQVFTHVDLGLLYRNAKKVFVECHNNQFANRDSTTSMIKSKLVEAGYKVDQLNECTLFARKG